MRVLASVHAYLPKHRAGSETMLHNMLKHLVARGHEVTVAVVAKSEPDYMYDGIRCVTVAPLQFRALVEKVNPDVIVSHHREAARATRLGIALGIPTVQLIHSELFGHPRRAINRPPSLVVFNTEWLERHCRTLGYRGPSIVVHPPVFANDHTTRPGKHVTLVNLNENKGGELLYAVAERLPNVKFLGVQGAYGPQIIQDAPNVKIIDRQEDMRNVWSQTRVLLMPSRSESYGMVAVEAAASGIPTIASDLKGPREALDASAMYVDRDPDKIAEAITTMLNDWHTWSRKAKNRSKQLDPSEELNRWAETIEQLTSSSRSRMNPATRRSRTPSTRY